MNKKNLITLAVIGTFATLNAQEVENSKSIYEYDTEFEVCQEEVKEDILALGGDGKHFDTKIMRLHLAWDCMVEEYDWTEDEILDTHILKIGKGELE